MSNSYINKDLNNSKPDSFDWTSVQIEMKNKLGIDVYESWLKKISFIEELNNYILLSVPTRFIRDWITSRYLDQILKIIKNYKKDITRVEFKIMDQNTEISKKHGAEVPFIRPDFLATDKSLQIDCIKHAVAFLEENEEFYDYIMVYLFLIVFFVFV